MFERADMYVEKILAYTGRHGMLPGDGAPLVLMVSGGSDSTALCLACRLMVTQGLISAEQVSVLHVNHGLRGEDSDNDALFVGHLAGLCGFRFSCVAIDIDARQADFGNNMESTARHLRYEEAHALLEAERTRLGAPAGAGRIWTAHTRDDRVETFYMRSIVGTGPGGFASIAARNGAVARPLLECGRQELRDFIAEAVAALGWELDPPDRAQVPGGLWREDLTNYETDGFRAFVRNRLVPVAEERNPALGRTLARSMDLIEEESAFIDDLVDEASKGAVSRRHPEEDARQGDAGRPSRYVGDFAWHDAGSCADGLIVIDLERLGELHPVLMRRLVHRLCKEVLTQDERVEAFHVERIAGECRRPGFAADLPGGARAIHEAGRLVLLSAREVEARRRAAADIRNRRGDTALLPVPGLVHLPGTGRLLAASIIESDQSRDNAAYAHANAAPNRAFLDFDRLVLAQNDAACESGISNGAASALLFLEASHWREGDEMCPLGMGGAHKKLSDLFIDRKMSREARGKVVVVRAGDAIAWVAGVAVDDRFKVGESGKMVLIEAKEAGESDVVG